VRRYVGMVHLFDEVGKILLAGGHGCYDQGIFLEAHARHVVAHEENLAIHCWRAAQAPQFDVDAAICAHTEATGAHAERQSAP